MPMNSAEFMGIFPAAALQRTPKGARLRGKRDFLRGKAPQKMFGLGDVNACDVYGKPASQRDGFCESSLSLKVAIAPRAASGAAHSQTSLRLSPRNHDCVRSPVPHEEPSLLNRLLRYRR